MEEVKFIKTGEEFLNISAKLKKECVDYLTQVTKENGSIEFDLDNGDDKVYISYDGGRHPEYISNLYSAVYIVSFNKSKNRLSIETEDVDDYTVERMSTDDLYTLAMAVYNKLK